MKKLSEFKDEEALDLLADLLDPCAEIFSDKELVGLIRSGERIKAVSKAIKEYKTEVVEIMAALEGVKVEDYHYNVFTLPKMVLNVINDKDLLDFFKSQGESDSENHSGSVTENTEEEETLDISSNT